MAIPCPNLDQKLWECVEGFCSVSPVQAVRFRIFQPGWGQWWPMVDWNLPGQGRSITQLEVNTTIEGCEPEHTWLPAAPPTGASDPSWPLPLAHELFHPGDLLAHCFVVLA